MTTGSRKSKPRFEVKPTVLNVLVSLEEDNRSESVINNTRKYLHQIGEGTYKDENGNTFNVNLKNPESVKLYIKQHNVRDSMKRLLCYAYDKYAKYYKIEWKMPKYSAKNRAVKVPSEAKIEQIITSAKFPLNLKIDISNVCGTRPVEMFTLRRCDIDFEKNILYPETAKGGNGRFLKFSKRIKTLLLYYIDKHNIQPEEYLFKGNAKQYGQAFRLLRNRIAERLKDPSYKTIKLYDLRHAFGTRMYVRFGDLRLVQKLMGHKHITTTEIYENLVLMETDPTYIVKASQSLEEDMNLISQGFEYIADRDGTKIYRKRKL